MRPVIYGVSASVAMMVVYFGIVSYFNSFSHAVSQFVSLWPFMILLIAGFGAQVSLFGYIREKSIKAVPSVTLASGTVSTGSMVACCAHHISDVLPFLGLSFAAAFVDRYQLFFLSLGIISNILGLLFMLRMIQRHKIRLPKHNTLRKLLSYDINGTFHLTLFVSIFLLAFIWSVS